MLRSRDVFPVHLSEASDPRTSTEESVPVCPDERGWKNGSESLAIAVGGE